MAFYYLTSSCTTFLVVILTTYALTTLATAPTADLLKDTAGISKRRFDLSKVQEYQIEQDGGHFWRNKAPSIIAPACSSRSGNASYLVLLFK